MNSISRITRAGAPVRKIRLFRCVDQLAPFPFDGEKLHRIHHQVAADGTRIMPRP